MVSIPIPILIPISIPAAVPAVTAAAAAAAAAPRGPAHGQGPKVAGAGAVAAAARLPGLSPVAPRALGTTRAAVVEALERDLLPLHNQGRGGRAGEARLRRRTARKLDKGKAAPHLHGAHLPPRAAEPLELGTKRRVQVLTSAASVQTLLPVRQPADEELGRDILAGDFNLGARGPDAADLG